jgi:antibiotic biosynthesis monooxygenase (ABM) superfamily enzyme
MCFIIESLATKPRPKKKVSYYNVVVLIRIALFPTATSFATTIIPRINLAKMDIAITPTVVELLTVLNFSPFVRPEGVEWASIKDVEILGHLELLMQVN